MKNIIFFLYIVIGTFSFSQKEELVIHRTHSSDIQLLEFSKSGKFLASLGKNSEIIIWHIKLNRLLTTFYIDDIESIQNMSFSENEDILYVKTKRTVFSFDISKTKLKDIGTINLRTNRFKNKYSDKNTDWSIRKGIIIKQKDQKKRNLFRLSANSVETKLTSFDISPDQKYIIAGAEDGLVYIYNYAFGVLSKTLTGHTSEINDVRFSEDGKFFASAGRDRSIIVWNTKNFEIENRISSSIYRKNTVTYGVSGKQIYVGDELGYIYEIDLNQSFPKINVSRTSQHAINKIVNSNETHEYFIATSNNEVLQKTSPIGSEINKKYAYEQFALKNGKSILFESLGIYQPPYGEVSMLEFSPSGNKMIYSGPSDNPNISLYNFKNRKKVKLYKGHDWQKFNSIAFIDDSTIIGNVNKSNVIYFWQNIDKKYYYKTDTLPFKINNIVNLGGGNLWVNTAIYGQYLYNYKARIPTKIMSNNYKKIFRHEDYIIFVDYSNALVFYNYKTKEKYFTFRGHSDMVTDISFHPENNNFVTSSFDGTIKVWDFDKKSLITTIIPFKNNDFIFITKENYYLISKGAINEFGFKYKNQYFYPDLFDIKYNRPDKVLKAIGSTNTELISAYYKAYKKRLKKLNYTEEQLGIEFHLPEIEIKNLLELPSKTESTSITLNLLATDSKHNLERINVWINGVAIYGIKGYNIATEQIDNFQKRFKIDLANGKNKIEVSVSNIKGAESYKKTFKILNTNESTKPNLYLVSIGVSKFKDKNYNLNYAAKDAKDIAATFKLSKSFNQVFVEEYTDELVTIENIINAKIFLQKAGINDMVIVFVAGHGVLDENFDYFFASHDMDFRNPNIRGIPYEMIESLVDNIKALKKLLFIDTCHSGELEKDEIEKENVLKDQEKAKDITFRNAGIDVVQKDGHLGLKNTNELMKSLFNDLRKGTGATIISSSGGTEYAIEGEEWKNGLFTYCLLRGIKEKAADFNNDKKININELQKYIQQEVKAISKGAQTPTSRIANTQLDYRIW